MPQWVERIVQEDLNVGTGTLWLKAPGGGEILSTQMGLHSVARGQVAHTSTWAPGAIAAGGRTSTTVTISDVEVGDFVLASHDKVLASELRVVGHVPANGSVQVVIHNPTTAAVTVPSGILSVLVMRRKPSAAYASVYGLITLDGSPASGAYVSVLELPATTLGLTTTDSNGYYSVVVAAGRTAFSRAAVEVSPGVYALDDSAGYTTALYVVSRADVALVSTP